MTAGNRMGVEGTQALSVAVRSSKVSSVRELILTGTDLSEENIRMLASTFAASKPMRVEKLSLGAERLQSDETLCAVLQRTPFHI